jgi:hypothetical protein
MVSRNDERKLRAGVSRTYRGGRIWIFTLSVFLWAMLGNAQSGGPCSGAQAGKVACLFSDVVVGAVQSVNPSFSLDPRIPLGTSVISTQLTSALPMPAPSAGYIFQYDPNLGTARAERQSYGPIFGQRAETIGLHRFSLAFTSQSFGFDSVDGIDLHHQPSQLAIGDYVSSNQFDHDLHIGQNVLTAIYGVAERVDVSVAVPFSTVDYNLRYSGSYKSANPNEPGFNVVGSGHRTAQGIGDVNVQVKGTILRRDRFSVATGATLRLPTGDAYNILGAGAAGIRPFVVASFLYKRLTPHLNLGYLYNGQSVLAADSILSGEKRRIPSQFQYAIGADAGITGRLTLAFDVLGYEAIHAPRLKDYPVVSFTRQSFNVTSGSAGFKARIAGNVIFQANLLFRLNSAGLRSNVTPLVGLSYAF